MITGKIGKRRYGGRVKGTPNRDTLEAKAIAERLKINPFEVLLYAAAGDWKALGYDDNLRIKTVTKDGVEIYEDRISIEARVTAAAQATKYMFPILKSVDATIANPDGTPLERTAQITPELLVQMVKVARGNK